MPTPKLAPEALDYLMKIPAKHARQVLMKIISQCGSPAAPDVKQLRGTEDTWFRADSGEYRIIFQEVDGLLLIPLIGPRNDDEVYKEMRRRGL